MKLHTFFTIALLMSVMLLLISQTSNLSVVRADDEDLDFEDDVIEFEDEEDIEDIDIDYSAQEGQRGIYSSPDVDTSGWIVPKHPDLRIPIGKPTDIIFSFTNNGDKPYKVIGAVGQIVNVQDSSYVHLNLTSQPINVTVQAEETNTLSYQFLASPERIVESQYGLVMFVYYTNEDNYTFANTFFNSTVSLYEETETFDSQAIFLGIMFIGITALIVFLFGGASKSSKAKSERKPSSAQSPTSDDEVDLDFVSPRLRKHLKNQKNQKK